MPIAQAGQTKRRPSLRFAGSLIWNKRLRDDSGAPFRANNRPRRPCSAALGGRGGGGAFFWGRWRLPENPDPGRSIRALIEQDASQVASGQDTMSLFTPELFRSLMESSRPEAELRLKRNLALEALADARGRSRYEGRGARRQAQGGSMASSKQESIDPARLRAAPGGKICFSATSCSNWLEEPQHGLREKHLTRPADARPADGPDGTVNPPAGEG